MGILLIALKPILIFNYSSSSIFASFFVTTSFRLIKLLVNDELQNTLGINATNIQKERKINTYEQII